MNYYYYYRCCCRATTSYLQLWWFSCYYYNLFPTTLQTMKPIQNWIWKWGCINSWGVNPFWRYKFFFCLTGRCNNLLYVLPQACTHTEHRVDRRRRQAKLAVLTRYHRGLLTLPSQIAEGRPQVGVAGCTSHKQKAANTLGKVHSEARLPLIPFVLVTIFFSGVCVCVCGMMSPAVGESRWEK